MRNIYKVLIGGIFGAIAFNTAAIATCSTYPYPSLMNGTTADASQVLANFNCAALKSGATLDSTTFTGATSFPGSTTITSSGKVGIGTASPANTLTVGGTGQFIGHVAIGNTAEVDEGGGSPEPSLIALDDNVTGDLSTFASYAGINDHSTYTHTGAGSATIYEEDIEPSLTASSTGPVAYLYGVGSVPANAGAGNVGELAGVYTLPENNSSGGTLTALNGADLEAVNFAGAVTNQNGAYVIVGSAGGTISTSSGVYIDTPIHEGGSIGTNYGLYVADQSGYASTNYQLYSNANGGASPFVQLASGNVGIGTNSPSQALEVNGEIKVDTLASPSGTNLCINNSTNVISSCSSSIRYKEKVKDAPFGLREVVAMRPVTFKWKGRNEHDLGFIAEEMEKINPLFVTYKDGKIEGVKYPQLTAVLSKAIQQQQTEIAALLSTTKQLKSANDNQSLELGRLRTQVSALQRKVGIQTAEK